MLKFSQIQSQNMFEICLSKNIQKSKFHDLTFALDDGASKEYQNKVILNFLPSRLLKSVTWDNN